MKRMYQVATFICLFFFANTTQAQLTLLETVDGANTENCGGAVAISATGHRVIIGCIAYEGINVLGTSRVYEENAGTWQLVGNQIDGDSLIGLEGQTVAMSGDGKRIATAAPVNDEFIEDAGQVRIFEEMNGDWVQMGPDIYGEEFRSYLGNRALTFSADGKRLAASSISYDNYRGRTRIFEEVGGSWVQIGAIDGEEEEDASSYSISLSSDGKRVAIGAPNNKVGTNMQIGHARVFEEDNGTWVQVGADIDGVENPNYFGRAVSLSADGKRLLVSAPLSYELNQSAGFTQVYEEVGGNWVQLGSTIFGSKFRERSGSKLSISADGQRIVIGAYSNSEAFPNAGAVRAFEFVGGDWLQYGNTIFGVDTSDNFGIVALSADGSRFIAGAATGNDGAGYAKVYQFGPISEIRVTKAETATLLTLQQHPNELSATLSLVTPKEINAAIYSLDGRLRSTKTYSLGSGQTDFTIGTSQLPKGMYVLHLIVGKENIARRFTKM